MLIPENQCGIILSVNFGRYNIEKNKNKPERTAGGAITDAYLLSFVGKCFSGY